MKQIKFTALTFGFVALSTMSLAQKAKETSAAVEYKNKFQTAMMTGDLDGAKKALLAAKGFIDEAAVHPDTENSQKTLWLKGEIYGSLALLQAQDSTYTDVDPETAIETSLAAYQKGYPISKKMEKDFEMSANKSADMMFMAGGMAYEKDMFAEAAEAYELAARYRNTVNVFDSTSYFNAGLCYERAQKFESAAKNYEKLAAVNYRGTSSAVDASRAYRSAGQVDKAKAIINQAREKDPSNKELLLELVNANIEAGDAADQGQGGPQ